MNVGVNEKSKGVGIKQEPKASLPPRKNKVEESIEDTHETNKAAWMLGAAGLGWWLFK